MNQQFDLFISYAREDEAEANLLHDQLDKLGISCWRDRQELSSDEFEFTQRIASGMDSCKSVIALLSKNYIESYYCFQEYFNALICSGALSSNLRVVLLDNTLNDHPMVELTDFAALSVQFDGYLNQINGWQKAAESMPGQFGIGSLMSRSGIFSKGFLEKISRKSVRRMPTVTLNFSQSLNFCCRRLSQMMSTRLN